MAKDTMVVCLLLLIRVAVYRQMVHRNIILPESRLSFHNSVAWCFLWLFCTYLEKPAHKMCLITRAPFSSGVICWFCYFYLFLSCGFSHLGGRVVRRIIDQLLPFSINPDSVIY